MKFNDAEFVFTRKNDKIVLIALKETDDSFYFEIDGLACRFFELLLESASDSPDFQNEIRKISIEFSVEESTVQRDLDLFITDLKKSRIII